MGEGGGGGLAEFVALGSLYIFRSGGVCKNVPPTLPRDLF